MPKMKLADWARTNGLSYITAHRHFHAGMIPNAQQLDSGTILVEVESPEQTMAGNSSNDAMSLFLKKTVEFSKNGSSVEDFAAYVISNFSLKLASASEGPRYSRQKPKSEDIQKHFQQFIPKGEKPKMNSFVMDKEAFEEISATNTVVTRSDINPELVKEFSQAVETPAPPPGFIPTTTTPTHVAPTPGGVVGAMSAEGTVTRSVDLNTTPQPINYTGSNNLTFGSSLTHTPTTTTADMLLQNGAFSTLHANNSAAINGIVSPSVASCFVSDTPAAAGDAYYTNSLSTTYDSVELDEIDDSRALESKVRLNQPRKRGRKPSKR